MSIEDRSAADEPVVDDTPTTPTASPPSTTSTPSPEGPATASQTHSPRTPAADADGGNGRGTPAPATHEEEAEPHPQTAAPDQRTEPNPSAPAPDATPVPPPPPPAPPAAQAPGDHDRAYGGVESGESAPTASAGEGGLAWEEPDPNRDRWSADVRDAWLRLVEEGWDAAEPAVAPPGEPRADLGTDQLGDTGVADAAVADTFVEGVQPAVPTVDMPATPAAPPTEGRRKGGRPRRARHRRRVRRGLRVRQRLWAVDPWSVFKISLLFYVSVFLIVMVAGTLLWNVGRSSGAIERAEGFITGLGAYGECVDEADVPDDTDTLSDADCPDGQVRINGFELDDGTIFRVAAIGGAILVVAGSVGNVLMVVLLNLINEVTGGLRHTVIREPVRRPPTRSNDPAAGG